MGPADLEAEKRLPGYADMPRSGRAALGVAFRGFLGFQLQPFEFRSILDTSRVCKRGLWWPTAVA